MLKKNFKNYIEEAVRDKYQKIDKSQSNVITLREKINNFDRFLDVYIKDETYGNYIEKFYLELEKMVCDEEKMSFKQCVIIDEFLKILASSRNIRLDSTNNLENLRTLNIITNDEMLEDIKLYFNDKTSLEKYLEDIIQAQRDMIEAYDDYLNYTQAKADTGTRDWNCGSTCSGSCGTKQEYATTVGGTTYTGYEVFFHDNDSCDSHIGWQMDRQHFYGSIGGGELMVKLRPAYTKKMTITGNIYDDYLNPNERLKRGKEPDPPDDMYQDFGR